MVFTRKFSQFVPVNVEDVVGLTAGANSIGPNSGGGGSGSVIVIINQDTSGLQVGDWVRINNAGLYVPALATSAEEAEVEGVVLEILSATQFRLQQAGYIFPGTPGFNGFTFNAVYFLSDVSLGDQTQTVPTINGHVSKPVFAADSADSGWVICLMRGVIIGTPGPIPPGGGGGTDTSIHTVHQPGHTFNVGDWVRVSADLFYSLADGTNLANAQSVGVVIAVNGDDFTIQFSGFNSNTVTKAFNSVGGLLPIVAATVYYISDVVPGQLTPTPPSVTGTATKPAFISESAFNGTGWVLPQRPLVNVSAEANPIIKTITQPGHGFLYHGLIVKPSTVNPGQYVAAVANTLNTAFGIGMIRQIIDVNTFVIQEVGYIDTLNIVPPVPGGIINPAVPLTIGVPYYLTANPLQAGQMVTVEPTSPNFTKPIFSADQTTAGWILPMKPTLGAGGGGGGGKIIQCLTFNDNTNQVVNYNNAAHTSVPFLTGVITPSAVTSKIRFIATINVSMQYATFFTLFRDGVLTPAGTFVGVNRSINAAPSGDVFPFSTTIMFVDSPATLLPVTYNIHIISVNPVGPIAATFNNFLGSPANTCWTLEEIAV